jgi:hypothetical protein
VQLEGTGGDVRVRAPLKQCVLLPSFGANTQTAQKPTHTTTHKTHHTTKTTNKHIKTAIVRLVDAGEADVNEVEGAGCTPLHSAAFDGWARGIELLLGLGAKLDASNNAGDRPYHFAANMGHADAAALLVSHGARTDKGDVLVQEHVPKVKVRCGVFGLIVLGGQGGLRGIFFCWEMVQALLRVVLFFGTPSLSLLTPQQPPRAQTNTHTTPRTFTPSRAGRTTPSPTRTFLRTRRRSAPLWRRSASAPCAREVIVVMRVNWCCDVAIECKTTIFAHQCFSNCVFVCMGVQTTTFPISKLVVVGQNTPFTLCATEADPQNSAPSLSPPSLPP